MSVEYRVVVNDEGNTFWYMPGTSILHRLDGPAVEYKAGDKLWYKEGKLHRECGPAIVYEDGEKRWYKNGNLHRENGPARICRDGREVYYLNNVSYTKKSFFAKVKSLEEVPVKEVTVADLEKHFGCKVKVVK